MTALLNFCSRTFFNFWYRIRPPEMVKYWKQGDSARAKVVEAEDGSYKMEIEGEKYLYPGFPKSHILTGSLAGLKHRLKNIVFNQAFAEMEKYVKENELTLPPPERMVPAVRHIWETFEKLENMEVVPDMKARITLIKKVMCHFLDSDDAYRGRAQMFLWLIDQNKVEMDKADLYFFRGKYYKPDLFKKIAGKIIDGYQY